MTRSAPQRRMHSIFSGEATFGTKIFAGTPSLPAAKATATPLFPPEAATTPALGISRVSRLANAPRALKEPACCKNSSLKMRLIESRRKSAPAASRMGVRRTWGLLIARKLRVTQPTASEHLKILQQAGLIRGKRIKQWTFYKRDEAQIRTIKKQFLAKV